MKRAVALPAVLFTVALTSALAVGSAYVSRRFVAGTRITSSGDVLQPSLESTLARSLASWDSAARAVQPIGTTVVLADSKVTRLTADLYLVVSEVRREGPPRLWRRSALLATTYTGRPEPVPGRSFLELP